jgi:hypothetical protein
MKSLSDITHEESTANNLWAMPTWMEPYRKHITNTGGNSIEELMSLSNEDKKTNEVLAYLSFMVEAQVGLLVNMHNAGELRNIVS